ncbi:MAG: nucleoside kinase [Tannerellaceae bacterium]|jgi:uridine kinase|nr:nucleoside kinase [Tannerellaceae bacterium]
MKETIRIYCRNTSSFIEVEAGASLPEIYAAVGEPLANRPLLGLVNNNARSLTYRCYQPKDVEFVDYCDTAGQRVYVRSLCHILSKAVHDLLPEATLYIEHPISKGYYCVIGKGPVDAAVIERIRNRMREIVAADMPFVLHTVRTEEAVEKFRSLGMYDKVRLAETAGRIYTSYYELDGYINFFYGCLTPSTGYITTFDLIPYFDGLLLRIPRRDCPSELEPVVRQDKMYEIYKESLLLLRALGLENTGDLNKAISEGRSREMILVAEAMQEKQIARIADQIAGRYADGLRIVLISGPSSSGKTTFAQRLGIQLMTNFHQPFAISLDDYFVERTDTPRDESGDYDYESLYALDLDYFNSDLNKLLAGEEISLPSYDFTTGRRVYKNRRLRLSAGSLLIIEGIHALNPELTGHIADRHKFRVYVSALTSISLDNHNWIPTADNRLLRRIVRDYRCRNYSPVQTIARWPSVRKGEDKWIYPYQETADAMFNSAMLYELAALRRYADPILAEVREDEKENVEARRLIRFLRYFNHISDFELPGTSLLREFLGGGSFTH